MEPDGIIMLAALPQRRVIGTRATRTAYPSEAPCQATAGFTLIELSIVLVIIGLIAGGVLVGQNLIASATIRAQITQVEKYNTAANTFYGKYGYLSGDIPAGPAALFGFAARGQYAGEGDGNGVIEGILSNGANQDEGGRQGGGETAMFWVDLSAAKLIDGGFTLASATADVSVGIYANSSYYLQNPNSYFPVAKLGTNIVYVYSGGGLAEGQGGSKGANYFGISTIVNVDGAGGFYSTPGITVAAASAIDGKIDDGSPQTGRVTANYMNYTLTSGGRTIWAAGGGVAGASPGTPVSGSPTTCYDNNGIATNPMAYSVTQNNGSGVNCALSFRMQAGD